LAAGRRRWLRWLLVVSLFVVLLALTSPLWLAALGGFLVNAGPPVRADLIVVLAGDWHGNRILKAGELIREGFAPKALVSAPRHHYGLLESDLAIPFAVRHGCKKDWFEPLPIQGASTEEEAHEVMAELVRRSCRRVIIVTSDYHTRRAGRIYNSVKGNMEIHMVAAPDANFTASGWWHTREGRKVFFLEWVKTITSPFGI
jgi:uncharacterized SAM-binding protein YcdF (DUF218 family)